MNFKTIVVLIASAGASLLISSCSTTSAGGGLAAYHAYDRPTKLPSNPRNVRVKVSLSKQRTYVMEGSEILLSMPVCVGTPSARTPAGSFSIMSKDATYRANSHGYAYKGNDIRKTMLSSRPTGYSFKGTPMPFWCEFKPNYGFHTGWVKHSPASHGCIRMHENLAPKFFKLVSIGTPVNIAYTQPEDALVGSIPLPPDAGPLPDYPGSMYLTDGYFKQYKHPTYQ